MKYFIKSFAENKSKSHVAHKGHLANEHLTFWKSVEDKYVPVLHDTNPRGSKRIWIPRSLLDADAPKDQKSVDI